MLQFQAPGMMAPSGTQVVIDFQPGFTTQSAVNHLQQKLPLASSASLKNEELESGAGLGMRADHKASSQMLLAHL